MQKILLKQTDSEIYFDMGYNKKGNRMIRRLISIQASRFVFIPPASFDVLQAIT